MSTAFERELLYRQLKDETTRYEQELKRKGWEFALGAGLAFVAFFTLAGFLISVWQEEISAWLARLSWVKLLFNVLFISVLFYIVVVQRNYHRLSKKKRELHLLLLKHPDLEKPVS